MGVWAEWMLPSHDELYCGMGNVGPTCVLRLSGLRDDLRQIVSSRSIRQACRHGCLGDVTAAPPPVRTETASAR
jgi:hypothetical protein